MMQRQCSDGFIVYDRNLGKDSTCKKKRADKA